MKIDFEPAFEFWGKSSGAPLPHSVPHHCLDVAAAAAVLLPIYPPPVEVPAPSIIALIALHDVGKFSRPFQAKVPELWPACLGPFQAPPDKHHVHVGYILLSRALASTIAPLFPDWINAERAPVLRAISGHHGRPPEVMDVLPSSVCCGPCIDTARTFAQQIIELLAPAPLPMLSAQELNALTWWLAGITTLADWLGSQARWFPRGNATQDLAAYWRQACAQAERAVQEAGLIPAPVATATGMAALFPERRDIRPLQRWAESVVIPEGPALFIVEDATGAGKTEAALVLAHRLMCTGRADGLSVALPTMATANAMYRRLSKAYLRLFTPGSRPSLALAHSKRALNDAFTNSILEIAVGDTTQCAEWIADDRRKAFFAQIGVGTIDQALMGVLPSKFAPLRLLGLSQRVLIVDEAHAYDAYMETELARLLEFHAAQGGSAIVLSATLTLKQRADLCLAYSSAAGTPCAVWPAVTVASATTCTSQPLTLAADLRRRVTVQRVPGMDSAADAIVAAAEAGAAVAWIRNTVDDAIDATELLRGLGLEPLLFHARFAMGDRLSVEDEVLRLFGPKSTPAERTKEGRGRVLIATQVVEQSLDLDFDLLVSEIAPADLIVQRAGRLWRHQRGARPIPGPRLLLLSPEPVADPPADWMGDAATRFVYDNPGVLWRSARALLSAGSIVTHDTRGNVRLLVEEAYNDANTPQNLHTASQRALRNDGKARGQADQNVLEFALPYDRSAGLWEPDDHTPTRDGEPQITVRLARYERGRLVPWCEDSSSFRAWCLSEVSVRASRLSGVAEDSESAAALATLRAQWARWDRDTLVLVLRPVDGATWHGRIVDKRGALRGVTYSRTTGWSWD